MTIYNDSYIVREIPVSNPAAVLVAIKAAQNTKNWGYDAAMRYCKKRGVATGVYEVALVCHVTERRKVERLPLFLLRQAG